MKKFEKLKKRIAAIILVLTIMFFIIPPILVKANENFYTARVNQNTTVYYGNSNAYLNAGTVFKGELVYVIAKNGNWVYIEYNTSIGKKRGYMPYSNLTCYNRPEVFPDLYCTSPPHREYISGFKNIRSGPTKQYPIIGSVKNETVMEYHIYRDNNVQSIYVEYFVNGTNKLKSGFIVY